MIEQPVSVLKIGSSVLRSEADLPTAVLEIYRELRAGRKVLAVVSAFGRTTDGLLDRARRRFAEPREASLAQLLATGEAAAAAFLSMALEEAGVPAISVDPLRLGIEARGATLDADPWSFDPRPLRAALLRHSVVVVPGFLARGEDGGLALLGRGGSDLTAILLAHRMRAVSCRLVKDVEGLLTTDPGEGGGGAVYRTASWETLLRLGGPLVQRKAAEYAQREGVPFTLTTPGAALGTQVGPFPDRLGPCRHSRPLRIALFGLGNVGAGLYRWLEERPERFEVVRVLVRDLEKQRPPEVAPDKLTADPREVSSASFDVAVEVIGGEEPARSLIADALRRGRHVVTANKLLLARRGAELERLASERGARLLGSASVGGAIPVLEVLSQARGWRSIEGVLNGTCNFVLGRVAEGVPLSAAVAEAQARGLAEPDPSEDLSGRDVAQKLSVLARKLFGFELPATEVAVSGLESFDGEAVRASSRRGLVTRLIGRIERTEGAIRASVELRALARTHPLADLRGEENGIVARDGHGDSLTLRGKGAGRWPTALSLMADLVDLETDLSRDPGRAPQRAAVGAGR